jgi:hypothetical protein
MGQKTEQEQLWTDLEVAVRTYPETLPVDAFLPHPGDRVDQLMHERAENQKPVPPEEDAASLIHKEAIEERIEKTEVSKSSSPVNETAALDDELRSQLSGSAFGDLDDV